MDVWDRSLNDGCAGNRPSGTRARLVSPAAKPEEWSRAGAQAPIRAFGGSTGLARRASRGHSRKECPNYSTTSALLRLRVRGRHQRFGSAAMACIAAYMPLSIGELSIDLASHGN